MKECHFFGGGGETYSDHSYIFSGLKTPHPGVCTPLSCTGTISYRTHHSLCKLECVTTPANRKFPFESNLESNQGVVVYMFSADCHVAVVYVL